MNENTYSSYPKATQANTEEDDSINIQQLVQLCVSNWYWFLASIIVALALAAAYILTTQPVYTRKASVLIKDGDPSSSITKAFGSFTSMGQQYTRTNLHNEMLTFKSPTYRLMDDSIQWNSMARICRCMCPCPIWDKTRRLLST